MIKHITDIQLDQFSIWIPKLQEGLSEIGIESWNLSSQGNPPQRGSISFSLNGHQSILSIIRKGNRLKIYLDNENPEFATIQAIVATTASSSGKSESIEWQAILSLSGPRYHDGEKLYRFRYLSVSSDTIESIQLKPWQIEVLRSYKLKPRDSDEYHRIFEYGTDDHTPGSELIGQSEKVVSLIYVKGKSTGVNWSQIERDTNERVSLLASWIGLYSNSHVEIVSGPSQISGTRHWNSGQSGASGNDIEEGFGFEIDDNCIASFDKIAADVSEDGKRIQQAIKSFNQGTSLHDRHHSMALLAYVAAIETIGSALVKPSECAGIVVEEETAHCENCIRKKGAGRAYREAVIQYGGDDSYMKKFGDELYRFRSATAHTGEYHGHEITSGYEALSFMQKNSSDSFIGSLQQARLLTRKIIANACETVYRECGEIFESMLQH